MKLWRVERLEGGGTCRIRGYFADQPTAQLVAEALAASEGKMHTLTGVQMEEALADLNSRIARDAEFRQATQ